MSSIKQPSTRSWVLIHIIFPMLPFLIEGIIRFIVLDFSMNLHTFNSSTLSASIGLLCLFINQNLLARSPPLLDSDGYEQDSIYGTATLFLTFAIISFVFFTIIVLLTAIVEKYPMQTALHTFEWIVFLLLPIPIIYVAVRTQRNFKLRAVI